MPDMIEAANTFPNFLGRQKLTADDLRRLEQPCAVFEHEWLDSDGARCFAYSVGGILDGAVIGGLDGGATIGGEVAIVHAQNRTEADWLASQGLQDTIDALHGEASAYIEAHAALARLASVGDVRRLELATAKPADRSDEFERDTALVTPLRGDDVLLTVGGVAPH